KIQINKNFGITIRIPQSRLASNMRLFRGEVNNNIIYWQDLSDLSYNSDIKAINAGKDLYEKNCIVCHDSDMRKGLSAPGLGNITNFRDSAFLVDFTRNSSEMIFEKKDQTAICTWLHNNKGAMNAFPSLSESDISNIYQFIESESRNQEIELEDVIYVYVFEPK
ncbi:MAG: cytochrome c, partial [Bacteroidota bacterium]